jgi:hypothetical protein
MRNVQKLLAEKCEEMVSLERLRFRFSDNIKRDIKE